MKKRILCISNRGWFMGGGEYSFADLIERLPADFEPIALVPDSGDLQKYLVRIGVETVIQALPAITPGNTVSIARSLLNIGRLIDKKAISAVYANGSRPALYGAVAGRLSRVPVVWHCRIAEKDKRLDWILRLLCSRIIANSRATKRRFDGLRGASVIVVENGVDIERIRKSDAARPDDLSSGCEIILHCARISKLKRQDLSLDAFESVAEAFPAYHMVFVGAADTEDRALARTLRLRSSQSRFAERIHWLGPVHEPWRYMKSARMLLLPSENEGFGRVIVEAMASGCVPIGTQSGGVAEIINSGTDGLFVKPGSVKSLAAAIRYLIENPDAHARMVENAMVRAQGYALERHVARVSQVLKDALT